MSTACRCRRTGGAHAGIDKRFGAVHANRDVTLTVAAGTVHGIVGENGAGKSTLMSILYGFYQADSGTIAIDGRPVQIRNSHEAIALGIGMVHQHFMLVDTLQRAGQRDARRRAAWRLRPRAPRPRAQRLEALMQRHRPAGGAGHARSPTCRSASASGWRS